MNPLIGAISKWKHFRLIKLSWNAGTFVTANHFYSVIINYRLEFEARANVDNTIGIDSVYL